jgi:ribosomal protein S18 acetylase RimI-like enzyme
MSADGDRLHEALCAVWERLTDVLEGARFERRDGYVWTVCPRVPVPQFNGVWPLEDSAAPELEAALADIRDLGVPASVQVRAGRTPAAEREAERLGLLVEGDMPGMLVDAHELRNVEAPGLRIVRVRTADGLAQALAVAAEGFDAPPELFAPLYEPAVAELEGVAIYLGRVGEVDVTTGVGFTVGDAIGIFTIATPPAHRGRGYGAAVTAHAARDGFAAGATFAYLQSSGLGHGVYRRLGFRDVERYLLYTAPEAPAIEVTG